MGELCERAAATTRRLALPAAVVTALVLVWTVAIAVDRNDKDVFPPVLPAVLGIAVVALAALFAARRRSAVAFSLTAAGAVLVVVTLFTSLYPRVMVSSTDFSNSLTIESAASSHYALAVISVAALVLTPIVLLYQGWTYYVFRQRLGGEPVPGEGLEPEPSPAEPEPAV